jgi:hypothetical protein
MKLWNPRAWSVTVAAAAVSLALAASAGAVTSSAVYDATPSPLPPNVASLGFQATSTSEFGDYVHLDGTDRELDAVTVTMSDWALHSSYPTLGSDAGWTHPITVNIYGVDNTGPTPTAGSLLATSTQTFTIPWRPEASAECGTAWKATDGQCYNGVAFDISFALGNLNVTLPDDVIVGIAYNTQSYGAAPIGAPGPYNSLNVGVPTNQLVTVGTDDDTDAVFWNTSHGPFYTDGGASGIGTFRADTNWTPNGTVAFRIMASAALVTPPTSKEQCKNEGWMTFNDPAFENQGQCL